VQVTATQPELTALIVNYNGWPDVARLVSALARAPEVVAGRCAVLVVDNDSDGPIPPALAPPPPGVRLLIRADNGGFAAGVNAGWRASRSPWLLLLNPDVVADPALIGRVLDRIRAYRARPGGVPGVVGFGLRNADGTRQPSVGARPGLVRSLREVLIPRSRRKYQAAWRTRPGPVAWVTGACALVDAGLLRELGGMDEDFFLYYEEVALCRSAWRAGRAVEYDPTVEVVHLHPLQNRPVSPKMRVITRHSKLLYFRKHLPGWQFAVMAAIVGAEAAVRGARAAWLGRGPEARAWHAIGRLAGQMRRGMGPVGRGVLALAEGAVAEPHPPRPGPRPTTTPGRRVLRLRKDGPE